MNNTVIGSIWSKCMYIKIHQYYHLIDLKCVSDLFILLLVIFALFCVVKVKSVIFWQLCWYYPKGQLLSWLYLIESSDIADIEVWTVSLQVIPSVVRYVYLQSQQMFNEVQIFLIQTSFVSKKFQVVEAWYMYHASIQSTFSLSGSLEMGTKF